MRVNDKKVRTLNPSLQNRISIIEHRLTPGALFMLGEIRAIFMSFWEEVQTWDAGFRDSQLISEEILQDLVKRYVA